ncbi:MAG: sporulation transcriptional regulator SpoIIID [Candidatus Improbicoccus devescovinae]|nr:MAG: sporulation transcriptional regulator SpoIIID [Candidatus Improbicoccus devescovinae]
MNHLVEKRAIQLGNYIILNRTTVRGAAKIFGISKSTVHKDVSERLKEINKKLYSEVKNILQTNKLQRHIRGGLATKEKYSKIKKIIKAESLYNLTKNI